MKHFVLVMLLMAGCIMQQSCEQSEGVKAGILQKVSHKTFPCDYYEIQVAFTGGVVETTSSPDGKSSSSAFSNTQNIKIDKEAYDTLQTYLDEKIIFDYSDDGVAMCGSSKKLTFIKLKNPPAPVSQQATPPIPNGTYVLALDSTGKILPVEHKIENARDVYIGPKDSDVKYK